MVLEFTRCDLSGRSVGHDQSESESARVNGARLQTDASADTEISVTDGPNL